MMATVVDLLDDAVGRYGERPALSAHRGLRDRIWSYQRLWESAAGIARHLRRDLGLDPATSTLHQSCAPCRAP